MAGAVAFAAMLAMMSARSAVPAAGAPAGSADVEPRAARGSRGCGQALGFPSGVTTLHSGVFAGVERTWLLRVPASYSPSEPVPLIVALHGWLSDGADFERYFGLSNVSEQKGFVVAYPNGLGDNSRPKGNYSSWGSWNVAGSTLSPGPEGPTCTESAGANTRFCYESCPCSDSPQCDWTTCHNDVTPTGVGTSSADGFLPRLYDRLAGELCIDLDRLYATGFSNGGMATYQLGVSLAPQLAAILPFAGSFHRGFNQAPPVPLPVVDMHGFEDTTVPANKSLSWDGWYYTPLSDIFEGWRAANGCEPGSEVKLEHWPTPMDGLHELYCVSEGAGCASPVVRCGFRGGHALYGGGGDAAAQLAWELLSRFRRAAPDRPEAAAFVAASLDHGAVSAGRVTAGQLVAAAPTAGQALPAKPPRDSVGPGGPASAAAERMGFRKLAATGAGGVARQQLAASPSAPNSVPAACFLLAALGLAAGLGSAAVLQRAVREARRCQGQALLSWGLERRRPLRQPFLSIAQAE